MSERTFQISQLEKEIFRLRKDGSQPDTLAYLTKKYEELTKPSTSNRDSKGRWLKRPANANPTFDTFSSRRALAKRWANHQYSTVPKKVNERNKLRKQRLPVLRAAWEKAQHERKVSPWENVT